MGVRNDQQLALFEPLPEKKISQPVWVVHIDGASRGNPGPSGIGIYVYDKTAAKALAKEGFFVGMKTNNQAEYLALVCAASLVKLLMLEHGLSVVTLQVVSDSELLIKQMQGYYRVKNEVLAGVKLQAEELLRAIPHTFKHVLREYNKVADLLANQGIDTKKKVSAALKELLKNLTLSLP